MKVTAAEKVILFMLADLHEHLKVKSDLDPKFIKEAITGGNAWALTWQYGGAFNNQEPTDDLIQEVCSILDMWTVLEASHNSLSGPDKGRVTAQCIGYGTTVNFPGFDANNEGEHLSVCRCLMEQLGRYASLGGKAINSHHATLDHYHRMLDVYGPIADKAGPRRLNVGELIQVLNA
jgi:uncharacterized protein